MESAHSAASASQFHSNLHIPEDGLMEVIRPWIQDATWLPCLDSSGSTQCPIVTWAGRLG